MLINLSKLLNNTDDKILIDDTIIIDDELVKTTEIRHLSPIKINGFIKKQLDNDFMLYLTINGEMILPCSISLDDVTVPFNIEVNDILSENEDKDEEYTKIINNSIDIMPIIWQNIVVEIPIKVVSPNLDNVKLEGDGWKLLTEEELNNEVDHRLDKLKDLLDD